VIIGLIGAGVWFILIVKGCKACVTSTEEPDLAAFRAPARSRQSSPAAPIDPEERRRRILSKVVRKKAVAKIKDGDKNETLDDDDDSEEQITLPHEAELSNRSRHDDYDEENPEDTDEELVEDKYEEGHYKTDITVSAKAKSLQNNLSSWRSNKCNSNLVNSSLRSTSDRILGEHTEHSNVSGGGSLYCPKTCAICLEKYKAGDEICWSKNKYCPHAFHLDCMTEWLMKSDDCPMCRENYLEDSDSDSSDEKSC